MTFDTSGIDSSCESSLFEFKAPVRIMTITALHGAFENLVMEGQIKLVLYFTVAAQAKLRLADFQQFHGGEAWLFSVRRTHEDVRAGDILSSRSCRVRRMAICTTDVVAPMFSAPEVIVLFSSGMAGKTCLRRFFWRLVFEGNNLLGIAFFRVSFTGAVTSLATRHLPFPTANSR